MEGSFIEVDSYQVAVDGEEIKEEKPLFLFRIVGDAFAGKSISSVTIPDFIRSIDTGAFSNCSSLQQVIINKSSKLESIEARAFTMSGITSFHVPRNVINIGEECFLDCKSLASFTFEPTCLLRSFERRILSGTCLHTLIIPRGVSFIDPTSFDYRIKISVSEENRTFCLKSGFLCSSASRVAVKCLSSDPHIEIPPEIERIGPWCFYGCPASDVKCCEDGNLASIDDYAFAESSINRICMNWRVSNVNGKSLSGVSDLEISERSIFLAKKGEFVYDFDFETPIRYFGNACDVSIPVKVQCIGSGCFCFESNIKTVSLVGLTLDYIGDSAFEGSSVIRVTLPKYIKELRSRSFFGCKSLKAVEFGESSFLEVIGDAVFQETALEELNLPWKVRDISPTAIRNVHHVSVDAANVFYYVVDGFLISKDNSSTLVSYVGDESSPTVPREIRHIGRRAFAECHHIECVYCEETGSSKLEKLWPCAFENSSVSSITLSPTLLEIGAKCFSGCLKLKRISFKVVHGSPPLRIEEQAFWNSGIYELVIPRNVSYVDPSACPIIVVARGNRHYVNETGTEIVDVRKTRIVKHLDSCLPRDTATHIEDLIICERAFYGCNDIVCPIFEGRITALVYGLFECSSIQEIVVPKSVMSIQSRAFYGCTGLEKVEFAGGVVDFGDSAFAGSGISEISIPNELQMIGVGCFENCFRLSNIQFPEMSSITEFKERAFKNSSLSSIFITRNVTSIGSDCFDGCIRLSEMGFDSEGELSYIGSRAFFGTSLTNIVVPASVTQLCDFCFGGICGIKEISIMERAKPIGIDRDAFCNSTPARTNEFKLMLPEVEDSLSLSFVQDFCGVEVSISGGDVDCVGGLVIQNKIVISYLSITHCIKVPQKVICIKERAFAFCSVLKELTFEENSNLVTLENRAFLMSGLEKVVIPKKCKTIGEECFSGCTFLISIDMNEATELTTIGSRAFSKTQIKEFVVPASVVDVGDECFSGCRMLESLQFTNGKMKILNGKQLFAGSSVKKVSMSPSLTYFPVGFLVGVESLESSGIFSVDNEKFVYDTSGIRTVGWIHSRVNDLVIPDHVAYIEPHCFRWCMTLDHVRFGNESRLKQISEFAFADSSLCSIVLPASLNQIGKMAFSGCRGLQKVDFKEGVGIQELGGDLFNGSALTSIEIPASVEVVNFDCFDGFDDVRVHSGSKSLCNHEGMIIYKDNQLIKSTSTAAKQHIPKVAKIRRKCFKGNRHLESIEWIDSSILTDIEHEAFMSSSISSITIPDSVSSIGDNCFRECSQLRSISFTPESKLVSIGKCCFMNSGLNDISIPSGTSEIGECAFQSCKSMTRVLFDGSTSLSALKESTFEDCVLLTEITIPKSVQYIGCRCFCGCVGLRRVQFEGEDSSIKTLDWDCFKDCNIDLMYFPPKLKTIRCNWENLGEVDRQGLRVFRSEGGILVKDKGVKMLRVMCLLQRLERIVIPSNVVKIKPHSFKDMKNLREVVFQTGSSLRSIGECAFKNTSISQIDLPESLETVKQECFYGCNLVNVVIPSTVTALPDKCFCECKSLESVSFRENSKCQSIGDECFAECPVLSSVTFGDHCELQGIGDNIFKGDTCLTTLVLPATVGHIKVSSLRYIKDLTVDDLDDSPVLRMLDDCFLVTDKQALLYCTDRESEDIEIPDVIEVFGSGCFSNCSRLKSLILRESSSLKEIKDDVLGDHTLQSFVMCPSLRKIPIKFFAKCKHVSVGKNRNFREIDGVIYSGDMTQLLRCYAASDIDTVHIPGTVEILERGCFENCKHLRHVTFDEMSSLLEIRKRAFKGTNLEKFDHFNSVEIVGKHAFPIDCDLGNTVINHEADNILKNCEDIEIHMSDLIFDVSGYERDHELTSGDNIVTELWRDRGGDKSEVWIIGFIGSEDTFRVQTRFERAVDAMIRGSHPCVHRIIGIFLGSEYGVGHYNIVTESLRGSLEDEMFVNWEKWKEMPTIHVMTVIGIVKGMEHLHKNNIMHRNLHPGNIMFDKRRRVRITGFEKSCDVDRDDTMTSFVDTVRYMAPEMADAPEGVYSAAVDVYSFGVILADIFGQDDDVDIIESIPYPNMDEEYIEIKANMSPIVQDLIRKCTAEDPAERPTFTEIFESIKKVDFELAEGIQMEKIEAYIKWIDSESRHTKQNILNRIY